MDELVIDRERVRQVFQQYVDRYDQKDGKIYLKIAHTYRVAEHCDRIARALQLSEYDIDLAWLIGMLHDVGRFEQLQRYGTFSDADSIDHAHFAVDLLFRDGLLRDYIGAAPETSGDFSVINRAVWNHSAYRIEDGLDERTLLFSKIIRDADKIDIFRVISETPIEILYGYGREVLEEALISPEVMQAFREEHAVLRSLKKTPVDYLIAHITLAFELEFPISRQITREQGYLQKLLSFQSGNPDTVKQFREIRARMEEYMV